LPRRFLALLWLEWDELFLLAARRVCVRERERGQETRVFACNFGKEWRRRRRRRRSSGARPRRYFPLRGSLLSLASRAAEITPPKAEGRGRDPFRREGRDFHGGIDEGWLALLHPFHNDWVGRREGGGSGVGGDRREVRSRTKRRSQWSPLRDNDRPLRRTRASSPPR